MTVQEVISVENLSHSFSGSESGIKGISLSINKGEFIILAGRNGSGKTTFLRHLNGLIRPDSGRIRLDGRDISRDLTQTRKTVGMIFQDADAQIVGETVFDDIAFGPENLKIQRKDITSNVNRIIRMLGIEHLKDRNPATLSGGEKRKVAIAGILVMNPEVIVCDEPFSNLDYPATLQILSILRDLNRSGKTLIVAVHDVETVISDATRLLVLSDGRLKADGKPADLVAHLERYGIREPCASKFGMGIRPWTG